MTIDIGGLKFDAAARLTAKMQTSNNPRLPESPTHAPTPLASRPSNDALIQALEGAASSLQPSPLLSGGYTVVAGDTLGDIATANGVDLQSLYDLNRATIGADPNLIQPGMQLQLPGSAPLPTSTITSLGSPTAPPRAQASSPPITQITTPTASTGGLDRDALVTQIRDLFERRNSPMAASVEALVDTALKHGVDPRLMVAIAGQESEFGTTNPESLANNPFGFFWNDGVNSPFPSWEEGYERVATRLAEMVNDEGLNSIGTLGQGDGTHAGYSPVGASNDPTGINNHWIPGVSAMYAELGGDPNNIALSAATTDTSAPASTTQTSAPARTQPTSSGAAHTMNDAERVHVVQFTDPTYNADPSAPGGSSNCGPASLAMALNLAGIDLAADDAGGRSVDESDIDASRMLMQGTTDDSAYSNSNEVLAGAQKAGASGSYESSDLDAMLGEVRSGNAVALAGNPVNAWPEKSLSFGKPYDGGHFVTISGYDAASGQYIVNDPLSRTGPFLASANQIQAYFNDLNGGSGVVVK